MGSEKEFQKTQTDYQSMKGTVKGYEAQLKLMGLNPMQMLKASYMNRFRWLVRLTAISTEVKQASIATANRNV